MEDMMVKPNLVMFQEDEGQGITSAISINCSEIEIIKHKVSVLKEDGNKSVIYLKNGNAITVIGTVQEMHSLIKRS